MGEFASGAVVVVGAALGLAGLLKLATRRSEIEGTAFASQAPKHPQPQELRGRTRQSRLDRARESLSFGEDLDYRLRAPWCCWPQVPAF